VTAVTSHAGARDVTNSRVTRDEPLREWGEPDREPITLEPPVASDAGRVCQLVRQQGIQAVNPADPRLLNLIRDGVTDEEFQFAAAEAVARLKGWAWMLAAIKGRRDEAQQQAQQGHAKPRQGANAVDLSKWLPSLKKGGSNGDA
jgi:hypothetical protein